MPFGRSATPHLPSPQGVFNTPASRKANSLMLAQVHRVPSTAMQSVDFRMSALEMDSRRHPTVPIAFVSGQAGSFAIASFQARHSHLVDGFAASGGASKFGGG